MLPLLTMLLAAFLACWKSENKPFAAHLAGAALPQPRSSASDPSAEQP